MNGNKNVSINGTIESDGAFSCDGFDLSQSYPWAYDQGKGLRPSVKSGNHISCSQECGRV
jgi:hypothetical protein